MPGNLAIFDKKQGAFMFEDFEDYNNWVISGHSLGGVMACDAVIKFPNYFKGLVLMAAYPKNRTDLTEWDGKVLSLYGSMDMIVDQGKIEASASLLPPSTIFHEISGGNHSYFGKYGIQEGDSEGGISREVQIKETVQEIQNLFDQNGWD
jgi:predicted esterase